MIVTDLTAILEAAISGDLLRAVELAEQDGLGRFDARRLTNLIEAQTKDEPPADDPNGAYEQGWEDAIREATWAVEGITPPQPRKAKKAS